LTGNDFKIKGSGKPLVLLHPFPFSSEFWAKLEPFPGYRLILPNFPGFGETPIQTVGYKLSDAAQDLQAHLRKLLTPNEKIILGGISMGGYWAFEFLSRFPDQVEGLILISTRPGIDKPLARENRLKMAERVEKEGCHWLPEAMVQGLLGSTARSNQQPLVDWISREISAVKPQAIALAQRAMAQRIEHTDLLTSIKARTLIMAGQEDSLIPLNEAEQMAKSIPDSDLKVFKTSGHLIPLEEPIEFRKSLEEFLCK